jgi:ABC-type sugar transport system permease subunit
MKTSETSAVAATDPVTAPEARTSVAPRRSRRRAGALAAKRQRAGIVFALPVVALVGSLLLYPTGQSVYYSFTTWDGLSAHWIGTAAYAHLFHSPGFSQVLKNNAYMILAIPAAVLVALGTAFLINTRPRGWRFFRSAIFLPTVISWVVIGSIAVQFFQDNGLLQGLLDHSGLGMFHPNMLSHEGRALVAVMITFIWSMLGCNMVIFLAGMATIDQEIYDAAKVDGAGPLTILFRITLPLLCRFAQFTFIFSLIMAFSGIFSLIFVMTGGGPGFGTTTLEFYIYQEAFSSGDFGTAATAGTVLFVAILVISMLQLRIFRGND